MALISTVLFALLFCWPSLALSSLNSDIVIESYSDDQITGWFCFDDKTPSLLVGSANKIPPRGIILGRGVFQLTKTLDNGQLHCNKSLMARKFQLNIDKHAKSKAGPGKHLIILSRLSGTSFVPLKHQEMHINIEGRREYIHGNAMIPTDCRVYSDNTWQSIPLHLAKCHPKDAWIIRGTNEDSTFKIANYFLPHDNEIKGTKWEDASKPYWTYRFSPLFHGNWGLEIALDKISLNLDLDQYSAAVVNDISFYDGYYLDENIFAEINVVLDDNVQSSDVKTGLARNRFTLGFNALWNTAIAEKHVAHLEINLFRTPNFDLCNKEKNLGGRIPTEPCDEAGIYDRRTYYNSGEVVYFDVAALNELGAPKQNAMLPGNTRTTFLIPISILFQRYPWVTPPNNWSTVKIAGAYIGSEIWGRGRMKASIDGYRVFRFYAD